MKKIARKLIGLTIGIIIGATTVANAQEKWEASVGADLVSSYIWRGQDLGGVSIQPSISIAKSGFSLTAWGSVGFDKPDYAEGKDLQEIDLTLGYEIKGFSIAVTDYYLNEESKYFNYSSHSSPHVFEATLGYDFGPVALCWNTNFAGNDYYKADGKRAYSTYIEASAPFKISGIDFCAEVGLTPWEGMYSEGSDFCVTNLGIKAAKDIQITKSFTIPVFAKLTFNPRTEGAYFAFGLSL